MNRLHLGLAVSVLIGVAIAFFPFYASALAPYLWHYTDTTGEEEHEEETLTVEGVVESADPGGQKVVVDGRTVMVRGEWTVEYSNGTTVSMESYELIENLLAPGTQIKIACTESGRWGLMAEEIWGPGFHAYKSDE